MTWFDDILDVIPVVGAVNRAAQGDWVDAGINLGGDLLGLVTGGAGKAAVAGSRAGAKAISAGVRAGAKAGAKAATKKVLPSVATGFEKGMVKAGGKSITQESAQAAVRQSAQSGRAAWFASLHASARPVAKVVEHGPVTSGAMKSAEQTAIKNAPHTIAATTSKKVAAKEMAKPIAKTTAQKTASKINAKTVTKGFAKMTAKNAVISAGLQQVVNLIPNQNEDLPVDDHTPNPALPGTSAPPKSDPANEGRYLSAQAIMAGAAAAVLVPGNLPRKAVVGVGVYVAVDHFLV